MAADVEQLLYHEADLLDSGLFNVWLQLLAADVRYWAPVRADVHRKQEAEDEGKRLLLFDETKWSLVLRIKRLYTGFAWVESPTTRTRRFVSNVMVENGESGLIHVRSNIMVFKSRSFSDETLLVGCRYDKWWNSGKWLLKERKVLIDHCAVENLSLLL